MYSDGYQDQMGGAQNKRFLSTNLKALFLKLNPVPFAKQKQVLDKTIIDWKGKNDQIDDIMIIGFKL